MQRALVITILFLAFIFITGCNHTPKTDFDKPAATEIVQIGAKGSNKLTLDIVKELAQKGGALTWDDFAGYGGSEIGSGLYIINYPIDSSYHLLIGGGNPKQKPIYIKLVNDKTGRDIDIRYEDVDRFLN